MNDINNQNISPGDITPANYTNADLGYLNLANAIVKQAAKDYYYALKKVNNPKIIGMKRIHAEAMKADVEKFFLSDWYTSLTSINGEYLMKRIQYAAKMNQPLFIGDKMFRKETEL